MILSLYCNSFVSFSLESEIFGMRKMRKVGKWVNRDKSVNTNINIWKLSLTCKQEKMLAAVRDWMSEMFVFHPCKGLFL